MSGRGTSVGLPDSLRFGFGTAIPCLVLSSALVIAGFVLAGADVGTGITLAFTLAFVLAMALEMARRYVLATRRAIPLFRTLVWIVIIDPLLVTGLIAAGVFTGCYGRTCADLPRFMLNFMFVCCLLCLPLIPFGYGLLRTASWLRPVSR